VTGEAQQSGGLAWRVPLGIFVAALWIFAAIFVMSMSAMGALMANDAGMATAEAQTTMVLGVLGGQALALLAGVPLGLAVFWRARRRLLVRVFAVLFGLGLLLQILGVYAFASKIGA